jgi:hypothetical protein
MERTAIKITNRPIKYKYKNVLVIFGIMKTLRWDIKHFFQGLGKKGCLHDK